MRSYRYSTYYAHDFITVPRVNTGDVSLSPYLTKEMMIKMTMMMMIMIKMTMKMQKEKMRKRR